MMSLNLSPRRLALFALCIGVFWAFDGFDSPYPEDHRHTRLSSTHLRCIISYIGGAFVISLIDHKVGTIDPTNIRPAWILIGLILAIGSLVFIGSIRETWSP